MNAPSNPEPSRQGSIGHCSTCGAEWRGAENVAESETDLLRAEIARLRVQLDRADPFGTERRMAVLARWTIKPGRHVRHDDGDYSYVLGTVEPRPESNTEPFEVVRADAYQGAVETASEAADLLEELTVYWEIGDLPPDVAGRFDAVSEALSRLGGQ